MTALDVGRDAGARAAGHQDTDVRWRPLGQECGDARSAATGLQGLVLVESVHDEEECAAILSDAFCGLAQEESAFAVAGGRGGVAGGFAVRDRGELLDDGSGVCVTVRLSGVARGDEEPDRDDASGRVQGEPCRERGLAGPRRSLQPAVRGGAAAELDQVAEFGLSVGQFLRGDVGELSVVNLPDECASGGRYGIRQSGRVHAPSQLLLQRRLFRRRELLRPTVHAARGDTAEPVRPMVAGHHPDETAAREHGCARHPLPRVAFGVGVVRGR
jgi:hypothetical protein